MTEAGGFELWLSEKNASVYLGVTFKEGHYRPRSGRPRPGWQKPRYKVERTDISYRYIIQMYHTDIS